MFFQNYVPILTDDDVQNGVFVDFDFSMHIGPLIKNRSNKMRLAKFRTAVTRLCLPLIMFCNECSRPLQILCKWCDNNIYSTPKWLMCSMHEFNRNKKKEVLYSLIREEHIPACLVWSSISISNISLCNIYYMY